MTRVTMSKDKNGNIYGYEFSGHAKYNLDGEDIVCAGLSTMAQFAALALQCLGLDIIEHNGYGYLSIELDNVAYLREAQPIFKALIQAVESLQEQYPENVKLATKESSCKGVIRQ